VTGVFTPGSKVLETRERWILDKEHGENSYGIPRRLNEDLGG
jgi:hypothetical protein